jgi:tRNA dimethylallyltransferase
MLQVVDPERAQQIHPNDYYRLNRALAIWRTTGKKPSDMAPVYDPACPYVIHCLSRDRAELYSRIDVRVNEMMHMGWVNEVKHLTGTAWEDFLRTKKIIGYIDILDYLQGDQSTESLHRTICAIQQKTRQYAKRQMTFWRKLQKDLLVAQNNKLLSATVESEVAEVNLTLLSVDLYIKQLLKKISSWFV